MTLLSPEELEKAIIERQEGCRQGVPWYEVATYAQLRKVISELNGLADKYEVVDDYSVLVEFRVAICDWLQAVKEEIGE